MTSKTLMEALVRAWDWRGVEAALAETPALADLLRARGFPIDPDFQAMAARPAA